MPPTISYRPQTLRQAKKAYNKSGAKVRLSESERAVIERRAVLQERADRIREREARRKANIKRRDEKIQREREARERMGTETSVKAKTHVGPSQLHLGEFVRMGVKRKREDLSCENIKLEKNRAVEPSSEQRHTLATSPRPSRRPLQVISTNATMQQRNDARLEKLETQSHNRCAESIVTIESLPPPPCQASPTALAARRKRFAKIEDSKLDDKAPTDCETAPMGPPPLPDRLQPRPSTTTTQSKSPLTAPTYKPPDLVDYCWDDTFVSNTQIVREISSPETKSAPTILHAIHTPSRPPIAFSKSPDDDTTSLLDLLSTQDLDISDILTQASPQTLPPPPPPPPNTDLLAQLSTQDLDFSPELDFELELELEFPLTPPPPPPPKEATSDFSDDLTASDLEHLAQNLETALQSSREPPNPQHPDAQLHAETETDVNANAFDFSTQDLRELAS